MDLQQYLDICAQSSPGDWNTITCWGARGGPSYLDQFEPGEYRDGFQLRHREHDMRASYRPDLNIGIAFGLDPDNVFPDDQRSFEEDWSKNFSDSKWTFHYADFFYSGALVHREPFVTVDGGRCYLPVPDHNLTVTRWEHDFFRVLDALEKASEYDEYFRQAGFAIRQ